MLRTTKRVAERVAQREHPPMKSLYLSLKIALKVDSETCMPALKQCYLGDETAGSPEMRPACWCKHRDCHPGEVVLSA